MIKLILNSIINIYQMLTINPKHFMCIISFNTHHDHKYYAQSSDGETEA